MRNNFTNRVFLLFCTFLSNYGQISWYHNMKTTQISHLRNTVISIPHVLDYDCGKVLTTSQQVSDEVLDIVFPISAFSKVFSEKSFFRDSSKIERKRLQC